MRPLKYSLKVMENVVQQVNHHISYRTFTILDIFCKLLTKMIMAIELPQALGVRSHLVCNEPFLPSPLDIILQIEVCLNAVSALMLLLLYNLTAHSSSPLLSQNSIRQIHSRLGIHL